MANTFTDRKTCNLLVSEVRDILTRIDGGVNPSSRRGPATMDAAVMAQRLARCKAILNGEEVPAETRQHTYEVCLPVSDHGGFSKAGKVARDTVVELAKQVWEEEIGRMPDFFDKITWLRVEFREFDSGNPGHAGAYYDVTVEGPQVYVDELAEAMEQ